MSAQATAPIPTIDFSRFYSGDNAQKKQLAQEIDKAFQTSGFLQLTNYALPQSVVDDAFDWSARFFSLPHEKKMLAPHPPGGAHHRGYTGVGGEKITQNVFDREKLDNIRAKAPDVKESFEVGNPEEVKMQLNIWMPEEEMPGFRGFYENFYAQVSTLVWEVLKCLDIALDLPEERSLVKCHGDALFQIRLLHYPPVQREILERQEAFRVGAHSDYATMTLLWQDNIGGLEVEDPNNPGVFRAVKPVKGAVVVNVADCLERWSNGRWRSCIHRVVAPPLQSQVSNGSKENGTNGKSDQMTASRYSIPFFVGPDPGTVVEALPGCFDETNPKKFEPIPALDYILKRMEASY